MAGARSIEPAKPINRPGSQPCGLSRVCWLLTASYKGSLRVNSIQD